MRRAGKLLVAAGSIALGTALFAADPSTTPDRGGHVELGPRIAEVGLTPEEYFENQAVMFGELAAAMPEGALRDPVLIEVTDLDLAQLAVSDPEEPLRIGLVMQVNPPVRVAALDPDRGAKNVRDLAGGDIVELEDGTFSWARSISSEGAGGIRVHLRGVDLPDGAQLFFLTEAGETYGPYVGLGINGDGDMWTDSVFSSTGILVLRAMTKEDLAASTFTITDVGHITPQFVAEVNNTASHESFPCPSAGNPSCVLDASCTTSGPAVPAKDGTAKMEWIAGAFIYTCTGGLLNDTNPSQDNFFLTANHCLSKNSTAKNVQFYWRFRTSSCNGTCPHFPNNATWTPKTTGSTVSATNRRGDFTLLHLNTNPPAGSVFLGWTSAAVANTGVALYRISNPNFGPQVYSDSVTHNYGFTCSGWPLTERIYSKGGSGGTDGGSSGSPVLNASSQVVGQLSGACGTNVNNACDHNSNATVDGRFSYYFNTVKPFINP